MTKKLNATQYYNYKELCGIAKSLKEQGYKITGKSLCDKNCNGGYGMNINNKLKLWVE